MKKLREMFSSVHDLISARTEDIIILNSMIRLYAIMIFQ